MRHQPALRSILLAAFGLMLSAPSLGAQRSDSRWQSSCLDGQRGRRERFCEVRESELRPDANGLRVDAGQNGGVEVIARDGAGISVHARIRAEAPTEAEAKEIAADIRIISAPGRLSASGPRPDRETSWSVEFLVYVPRRLGLSLEAYNGPISVFGVTGRMELNAVNGPISLTDIGGDVHARTQNGPLTVSLAGARWDGEGLDASTQNGPVVLDIPPAYSARLETGTVNGPMSFNFPITLQGRITRRISTVLGKGGPTVRAVTTNGPVIIRER